MGEVRTPTRREAPADPSGRVTGGPPPAPGGTLPRPVAAVLGARFRLSLLRSSTHRAATTAVPPR